MILSKCIADHIRENIARPSKLFTFLYVIAVIVRIVEVLAILGLVWLASVLILCI